MKNDFENLANEEILNEELISELYGDVLEEPVYTAGVLDWLKENIVDPVVETTKDVVTTIQTGAEALGGNEQAKQDLKDCGINLNTGDCLQEKGH